MQEFKGQQYRSKSYCIQLCFKKLRLLYTYTVPEKSMELS
jgi:hypothetical protein